MEVEHAWRDARLVHPLTPVSSLHIKHEAAQE
jgi:hypothetical protein